MNTQLFKKEQTITDLARAYDVTVRSLISCTFDFASRYAKISDSETLKHYKQDIIYALWNGSENVITNRSVIGSNDIYATLRFMQGLVKPSEKYTTDNFYNDNVDSLLDALNKGVNRILTEIIKNSDEFTFTEKQKDSMISTLIKYKVSKKEVGENE